MPAQNLPGSLWAYIRLFSPDFGTLDAWGSSFMGQLRTGRVEFEEARGLGWWEFLHRNPDKWSIFNEAMRSLTASISPAVNGGSGLETLSGDC